MEKTMVENNNGTQEKKFHPINADANRQVEIDQGNFPRANFQKRRESLT